MTTLSDAQRQLVDELGTALGNVTGVAAVVLGGSHARGRAVEGSDIDLGLLYREADAIDVGALRELADHFGDVDADGFVTEPYEWGPWANGGAWLRVRGERVDWIYRSLDQIERVADDARAGHYEIHHAQQPPFGFFGPSYLGELGIAVPICDPEGIVADWKSRVARYPDALRRAIVSDQMWAVEFGLSAFASKYAARANVWLSVASLARFAHQLTLAIFALNRVYPVNDKTLLDEIQAFDLAPERFGERVEAVLAAAGHERASLEASVAAIAGLHRETAALAGDLYRSRPLPP